MLPALSPLPLTLTTPPCILALPIAFARSHALNADKCKGCRAACLRCPRCIARGLDDILASRDPAKALADATTLGGSSGGGRAWVDPGGFLHEPGMLPSGVKVRARFNLGWLLVPGGASHDHQHGEGGEAEHTCGGEGHGRDGVGYRSGVSAAGSGEGRGVLHEAVPASSPGQAREKAEGEGLVPCCSLASTI